MNQTMFAAPVRPRRLALATAAVAAALALPAVAPATAQPDAAKAEHFCAVPEEFQPRVLRLRHTRAAHRAGKPIVIVALGTSSTAGVGAGNRGEAYPAQLEAELRRRLPGRQVAVVNKGIGGQTARRMVGRLEDDVVSLQPQLVIWQTGTVDAANSVDPEEFARAINQGIEILTKEGIDVILMNMQYWRRLEMIVNYEPYVEVMAAAAVQSDAMLFDRLEMMRHWADTGRLDFDNVPRAERSARASRLHHCIAWQLANVIESAVR